MKKSYLIISSLIVLAAAAYGYNNLPFSGWGAHFNYFFYHLAPAMAVICAVFAARRYGLNNVHGRSILYMSLGLSCWFIADLISNATCFNFNETIAGPLSDIIYILGYPFIMIGFAKELKFIDIKWTGKKIFYALLLSFTFVISATILISNNLHIQDNQSLETIINLLYAGGDAVLAIMAVFILIMVLEYQKGKMFLPWLYIFIGIFLSYIGDIFYSFYSHQYEQGLKLFKDIDLIYVASYLFFAYGFFSIDYLILQAQKKIKEN